MIVLIKVMKHPVDSWWLLKFLVGSLSHTKRGYLVRDWAILLVINSNIVKLSQFLCITLFVYIRGLLSKSFPRLPFLLSYLVLVAPDESGGGIDRYLITMSPSLDVWSYLINIYLRLYFLLLKYPIDNFLDVSIFSVTVFWVHDILHRVLVNLGKELMELTHLQRMLIFRERHSIVNSLFLNFWKQFVCGGQVAHIERVRAQSLPFPSDN